jgi:hypothetical protein
MECPHCHTQWEETIEIKDDPDTWPETVNGRDTSVCPKCSHAEAVEVFVEYDDDVWRVPGADTAST